MAAAAPALPYITAGASAAGGLAQLQQGSRSQVLTPSGKPTADVPAGTNPGDGLMKQLSPPQVTQFPLGPMPNVPVPSFDQSALNQNLMSILQTLGTVKGGF